MITKMTDTELTVISQNERFLNIIEMTVIFSIRCISVIFLLNFLD